MRGLFAVLASAAFLGSGGVASASTAETQARLAAARPVATEAVTPAPPTVRPEQPPKREPLAAAPRPDLESPQAQTPRPTPKPAQRHDLALILLLPPLFALVALVRWFARRRRSASKRV